jgi:hypothetical protein
MTPEGKVKKEIKAFLDALAPDCWYYMPVPMGYGRRGIPDFIVCYCGWFFAIETKSKNGVPTPWQLREMHNIHDAGGDCLMGVTGVHTVAAFLVGRHAVSGEPIPKILMEWGKK